MCTNVEKYGTIDMCSAVLPYAGKILTALQNI